MVFLHHKTQTHEKRSDTSSEYVITGKVVDQETGEALPGVRLVLDNGEKIYSDFEGNFSFSGLDKGTHRLQASYISYQSMIMQNIPVQAKNRNTLKIQLRSVD